MQIFRTVQFVTSIHPRDLLLIKLHKSAAENSVIIYPKNALQTALESSIMELIM